MQKSVPLFAGIFGAFALSVGAMILIPHSQLASLQPQVQWDEGQNSPSDVYPQQRHMAGREVYVSEGCIYCHSQQVRDPQYGPDAERGWGSRRTVARDYLHEDVPLLGGMRLGPDFSNFGWIASHSTRHTEGYRGYECPDAYYLICLLGCGFTDRLFLGQLLSFTSRRYLDRLNGGFNGFGGFIVLAIF